MSFRRYLYQFEKYYWCLNLLWWPFRTKDYLGKSSIYFRAAISTRIKAFLLSVVGMKQGNLSFNYLGVPIFKGAPKSTQLRPIVDRILARLNTGMGKTLSFAGQVCLVNSIINPKFIHSFMIYKWSTNLLKTEQINPQLHLDWLHWSSKNNYGILAKLLSFYFTWRFGW